LDPEEDAAVREEVAHVRKAIALLPDPDRRVLSDFLFGGHTSERKLAQTHGLSRYEVRGILVNCFGQLARKLLRHSQESLTDLLATTKSKLSSDELDHLMVLATWGEGRSANAAAALFETSEDSVRSAQRKYVRNLIAALRR
jgi:DNA-directed RNA polymerase specialized sigma24 family protein